jgi:hypothetical protein
VFFQWQRQGEEQLVSAIDVQQAIPTDDSSTLARFFPRSPGHIKTLGLRQRLIYLQCHILALPETRSLALFCLRGPPAMFRER